MRRYIKWVILLAILGGIGWAIAVPGMQWWRNRATPRYAKVTVSRGSVETVVNSTGTVKAEKSISVGSFVSGPIQKVYVDFNSEVMKGQLLAEIDPRLFEAAVKRDTALLKTQESDKARVEALLRQARNNEERGRKLMEINRDYLSGTEFDQLRANRESLEAQLELSKASINQATANLANSQQNLAYTKITSPVDGIVIERKVDDGQTVASAFQTPEMFIVAVGMDKAMHVFASVDEADIGLIREAQNKDRPVSFTVDAYPQEIFPGKIFQVRKNSTTVQNVVTYPVVIIAENPNLKLMPGMTANITFHLEKKENVLRIPSAALRFVPTLWQVRQEDRKYLEGTKTVNQPDSGVKLSASEKAELAKGRTRRIVWVDGEKGLRAVSVTLGLMENQYSEMVEGELKEGDELVTGMATGT